MHHLPFLKFFITLFFMMSSFLVAADPLSYADDASATPLLDYFPIIVFSETGGAANIFQFISGFAQEFSSGDLWWIGVLAMGVATIAGTIKAFQKQSAGAGAKELIFPVIMAIILLAPSETVRIFDGRTNSSTDVRIVENVPWFVAATASVSSVFTARLMNIVDDASSAISSTTNFNYGAQGLAAPENFALRAIQKIRMDENITTAINTAVKECLVPNAVNSSMFNYIGTYKNVDGDFNSFEAMRQIPINDIDIFNTVMTNGQMCGDYIAQNFSPTVEGTFETKIQAVLSNLNFLEIDKLAALSAQYFGMSNHPDVNDTYSQTLANFSGYLKNYNFEGALAGAIVNARAEAIGGGDNTAIIAQTVANASMGNLQTSGIGSWRALSELVPTAHNYLLIIIYGASALMALVVLASGYEKGMMILKEYFFGLMTFEFIKVAFALANNVMLFYSQERALDLLSGATKNELNPASMPMIGPHLEYLANMAGMAGALGLAAMIMIPRIVFGGKVASAMGVLGNVGGMVQNKSPQSAVEDIAKAKGMQKANSDVKMRAELEKAGIHVGPNSDAGSVYSAYMADMDKSAKNTAESSMYRDYDKRYGAVKAQSIQSSAGMIGAGQAAEGYTYDQMKSAGAAVGATGFTGQMAQGQELLRNDHSTGPAVDEKGNVSENFKMGQRASAGKQVASILGAGALGEDGIKASRFAGYLAGAQAVTADKKLADKFGHDMNKAISVVDHTKQDEDNAQSAIDAKKAKSKELRSKASNLKSSKGKGKIAKAQKKTNSLEADGIIKEASALEKTIAHDQSILEAMKKREKTQSLSAMDMIGAEAEKAVQSRIGQAAGIINNLDPKKGGEGDIYSRTAMSGEMSQAQTAMQKINAFGSIADTVAADKVSALKSAVSLKADTQAFSASFGGGKDILSAMREGGSAAAKDIATAMNNFSGVAYQTAHQGYQSQIGNAKGYVEERAKNGDNYQAKLAESSTKSQAESGMASIKAMQDYKGLSQDAAINALAHQASRQSYVQTKSTAQDMSMKDKAFGSAGYEDSGMTMARKQSDEAIGATKGIKHELKKRGDKGFQDVAQSGVESQVESGLGAIRGAGGIHSLAWQGGVKAQSDSNALRVSIGEAGGAGGYIGMNALEAVAGTRSTLAAQRLGQKYGGYANLKAFAGEDQMADSIAGASGKLSAGAAVQKLSIDKHGKESLSRPMVTVSGLDAKTTSATSKSNTEMKDFTAKEAEGVVEKVSGANLKGKHQSKSLGGMSSMQLTDMGAMAISNQAIGNALTMHQEGSKREQAMMELQKGFDNGADKEKTLKAFGINKDNFDKGIMSNRDYAGFLGSAEKKIDQREIQMQDANGKMMSGIYRSSFNPNAKGGKGEWSDIDYKSLDSTRENKEGDKQSGLIRNAIQQNSKKALMAGGMSEEEAESAVSQGTSIWDGGKEMMVGAATLASAYGYNKYTQGVVASKVAPSGQKVFSTKEGGFAIKSPGGDFYASDEHGNGLLNNKGKPIEMEKSDLKGGIASSFERMTNTAYNVKDRLSGSFSNQSKNEAGNTSQHNQSKEQDSSPKQSSEHNTPPKTTGSNPSNTHNSTTYQNTPQGGLAKAKDNLQSIKSQTPENAFKTEMAVRTAEAREKFEADKPSMTSEQVVKTEGNLRNIEASLASGKEGNINLGTLKGAGISTAGIVAPGGKIDIAHSGEAIKAGAVHTAENAVHLAKQSVDLEQAAVSKPTTKPTNATIDKPQKRSEQLAQAKQSLIDKQSADPRNPPMTKTDYKEALSQYDSAIHEAKGQESKAAYKAEQHQKRSEAREGRQASIFESMKENIAHSSVGETASDAMKTASSKMDEALQAAEHTGGGVKGKALAFGGTLLAGTALSSLFSSNAEAAEVPVSVKAVAKPVPASGGMLDNVTDTLGLGALGTSAVGILSKTAAKVAPGVGAAYGVVDTANRTSKGDYAGAAMSAAIGGASMLPIGGTAVAIGLTGVQIATDAMGITGGDNSKSIPQTHASTPITPTQTVTAKGADPVKPTETANTSSHQVNTPNGKTVPSGHSNTANNTHHNDAEQIRPLNESAIAKQQYQDHANRASYVAETLQTGAYQHIQAAVKENPVHPAMVATSNQRMGQEVFAAMAASHNQSTQGSSNAAGAQMTSIDIQQAHQTRQLAQVQADYIREVSRGMDEMVQSLGSLGEHFENFFNKADGKVNEKA